MKGSYLYAILVFFVLMSCGSSKNQVTQAEIDALTNLVQSKKFTIDSEWAYPMATASMQRVAGLLQPGSNAGSINLIGNSNFLNVSGNTVKSYLPYFGERQMGGAYGGGDSAIQFDGETKDYKVSEGKNNSYIISFDALSNSENFRVIIKVFPNMNADMSLTGNNRQTISYSGKILPLKEEKAEK
ncbi:DUF4251 domain-containing protein [Tamlana fucoidanivorans]|uniref:DUF4251 domain-containing protein n=1 Tax=Allotamlana fucoidanivorans TaxID=2583814 RepID=A0A5C4SDQ3_9FLAO|nr:DUF4251 domain-containing protein [Tamlana fucoidanivorans]TNJ41679.1 DUF4251 domain-containing protein [Tamlana fucoidanivorans]